MRICIPETFGRRGAGLGNELFPWAKAFLASQALGTACSHPAWGLNARGYYRDFNTTRCDWLYHDIVKLALPTVSFDEQAYYATGKEDYGEAVVAFADQHDLAQRRHFVFLTSGMWGGFHAIRQARVFVLAELLKARMAVKNVHAMLQQVPSSKALVAVHIRRGDFAQLAPDGVLRGRFNVALPLAWYMATCASIKHQCGDDVQFLLLTDATPEEVQPFIATFAPLTTFHLRRTACSDLLLMAYSDSIVCSVSSYSMWGAFLSNAPYVWCAPNLQDHAGYGSLWGHQAAQQASTGVTARNLARIRAETAHIAEPGANRGVPVDFSGEVPAPFCEKLLGAKRDRAIEKDLIFFGAVKTPAVAQH